MMRNVKTGLEKLASLALLAAAMLAPSPAAKSAEADIVFRNGTVYTADRNDGLAECVAVAGGRISFVGSERDGAAFIGPGTEVVDLAGGMAAPGFVDTHIHVPGPYLIDTYDFNLGGLTRIDDILETIGNAVAESPDQEAYFGFGFAPNVFTEGGEATRGPRKERLDALCPDKPVVVMAYDGHSAWLNSRAFEAAGVTPESVAPKGGLIELDPATGELWGTLKDTALGMVPENKAGSGKMRDAILRFQALMHSLGYTSVMAMASYGDFAGVPWKELRELDEKGLLTLRIRGAALVDADADIPARIAELDALRREYNGEFLKMTAAKIFADGAVDMRTALLLDPYADAPDGARGERAWDPEKMKRAFALLNAAGYQIHTHAIGDGAVRMTLDAYRHARDAVPAGDHRNIVTHLQLVAPDDIRRFKELSAIACVQTYWHQKEPNFWEVVELPALGRERAEKQYPLKSLFDAGVVVTASSDSPVTVIPDALKAIQAGVTRNLVEGAEFGVPDIGHMDDPAFLLWPEERVGVADMLRAFTSNAAYAAFNEDNIGSLEAGKLADLIVLDKNLLEAHPLDIRKARVVATYVNGKAVYKAGAEPGRDGDTPQD